ncbi:MFS transporter [Chelativorans salis]|uniref:MFS transporter n=1 Tax=Chelativorans salis TaxID=2978478 RepID=A0ABT2LTJ0_9HYPH|nr:MFS transporter [Chelativorans sp. EGI FJ00035]MCT7377860.1 MFS transporter [Chelativorans sp. EGI FJ00035]
MSALSDLRSLTRQQRNAVVASFLGWTLDAFDFFILVFVLKYVATEFGTDVASVTIAITLTLAMRPVGALLFGYVADRFGRRPTLMVNILLYSALEFASGFAPSLTALIVLRALYGIAMGGEWGVGASLTMETIPPKMRGLVSGLLQAGYPAGYLVASLVFFLLFPYVGWRGMFMLGALPALVVFYIRSTVDESPVFLARQHSAERGRIWATIREHAGLFVYAVLLMTAFNFFSHGTQDLYPTFLEVQRNLSTTTVGTIAVIYNIGAILGGITFGMLSEKIGRRRGIIIAALLTLPVIPLWVYSSGPVLLAAGAFLMQFAVQGAWGIIPAHLNELSPDNIRGTFPGFTYQLGNLLASANATMQAGLAEHYGNDYAFALALVIAVVAIVVALLAGLGVEAKGIAFGRGREAGKPHSGRPKPPPSAVTGGSLNVH